MSAEFLSLIMLIKVFATGLCLRTFALIVSAHTNCARKFACHVMHRARALSTTMNNDRADVKNVHKKVLSFVSSRRFGNNPFISRMFQPLG